MPRHAPPSSSASHTPEGFGRAPTTPILSSPPSPTPTTRARRSSARGGVGYQHRPFPRLPTEILHAVLVHHADAGDAEGRRTLRECLVVSRHFYEVALPLLFRRVSARSESHLLSLRRLLKSRPHLARSVLSLSLTPAPDYPTRGAASSALLYILSTLSTSPHLTSLTLHLAFPPVLKPSSVLAAFPPPLEEMKALRTLDLSFETDAKDVEHPVAAAPWLERIVRAPQGLENLRIECGWGHLLKCLPTLRVKRLRVTHWSDEGSPVRGYHVERFNTLVTAHPTLQTFEVEDPSHNLVGTWDCARPRAYVKFVSPERGVRVREWGWWEEAKEQGAAAGEA